MSWMHSKIQLKVSKTHTCKLWKDDHTSSLAADIIPPDPGTGKATLQSAPTALDIMLQFIFNNHILLAI
jgi:hypothetical protein